MTWRLALLYERQKLLDGFGSQFCTSLRHQRTMEMGGRQRELDQDRIAVTNQHAGPTFGRAALPSHQRKPAAKERMGWISHLNLL
jgi:hypothetical protein